MAACEYCKEPFGVARVNWTENRPLETDRGAVHMRCVSYWLLDLGIETAFGHMDEAERRVLAHRLDLPTVERDPRHQRLGRTNIVKRIPRDERRTSIMSLSEVGSVFRSLMERAEDRADRLRAQGDRIEQALPIAKRLIQILEGDAPSSQA